MRMKNADLICAISLLVLCVFNVFNHEDLFNTIAAVLCAHGSGLYLGRYATEKLGMRDDGL
jgi:hypothetical protein